MGATSSIGKRALQIAVTVCSLVPIIAGGAGVLLGPVLVTDGANGDRDLDSHSIDDNDHDHHIFIYIGH